MSSTADRDTTAHRYFTDEQIATACHSMDRGLALVFHVPPPAFWPHLPRSVRAVWIERVGMVRSGLTAKEIIEATSGEPWSHLTRPEQIRAEMFSWLTTGMGVAQL